MVHHVQAVFIVQVLHKAGEVDDELLDNFLTAGMLHHCAPPVDWRAHGACVDSCVQMRFWHRDW